MTQKELLKRPEARFPLFHNKHRLPLHQVSRLAHHSQDVESTPFAHDGNGFGTGTATVLSTLLETKLRFSAILCVQVARQTHRCDHSHESCKATRRVDSVRKIDGFGTFYRCKVTASGEKA